MVSGIVLDVAPSMVGLGTILLEVLRAPEESCPVTNYDDP